MAESANRINSKILNCHLILSAIYDSVSNLREDISQEDLDRLSDILERYNNLHIALKNSIKTFILEISNVDTEEIDIEPGENGFKI